MQEQHISKYIELIDKLRKNHELTFEEYLSLIQNRDKCSEYLFKNANEVREEIYGKDVYIRGLIEFSNYCKNDCLYCGIRRSNKNLERYRLSKEEILDCAKQGYDLGFRTFVLQSGEDRILYRRNTYRYCEKYKIKLSGLRCNTFTWRKNI